MLINQFVLQPVKLLDVHSRDVRHIFAARCWCILRHAGHDPMPRLLEYFSCGNAARRFGLLMETLTFIWPEPFRVHRRCCQTASLDETILIRVIQLASINARPSFDSLLQEMLAEDARNMLFARARQLYLPTDGNAIFQ